VSTINLITFTGQLFGPNVELPMAWLVRFEHWCSRGWRRQYWK